MSLAISTRPMSLLDLDCVVSIHLRAFQGFFLSRLGRPFLFEYYNLCLLFYGSIAIVAVDEENTVLGFVVGFKYPSEFYKLLRSCWYKFLASIAYGLSCNPLLILDVLRNLIRVKSQSNSLPSGAELSSIAVSVPRAGIGSLLISKFSEQAFESGSSIIFLLTDVSDNSGPRKFYESNGFKPDQIQNRNGRMLSRYIKTSPTSTEFV